MTDPRTSSHLSGLLLALALLGGVLLLTNPLQSPRPQSRADQPAGAFGVERVPARLWEDPFEAAQRLASTRRDHEPDPREIGDRVLRDLRESLARRLLRPDDHVTVLLALLPGGGSGDDTETRRRLRYAVVSAIGRAGLNPLDGDHIGAFPMALAEPRRVTPDGRVTSLLTIAESPTGGSMVAVTSAPDVMSGIETGEPAVAPPPRPAARSPVPTLWVPFEWFDGERPGRARDAQASAPRRHVLVLWMNEDYVGARLAELLDLSLRMVLAHAASDPVRRSPDSGTYDLRENLHVRIIGPSSSTGLLNLLHGLPHRRVLSERVLFDAKRLADEARKLVDRLDGYLDERIPTRVKKADLRADLARAMAAELPPREIVHAEARERLWRLRGRLAVELRVVLGSLKDSDDSWAETVTDQWADEIATELVYDERNPLREEWMAHAREASKLTSLAELSLDAEEIAVLAQDCFRPLRTARTVGEALSALPTIAECLEKFLEKSHESGGVSPGNVPALSRFIVMRLRKTLVWPPRPESIDELPDQVGSWVFDSIREKCQAFGGFPDSVHTEILGAFTDIPDPQHTLAWLEAFVDGATRRHERVIAATSTQAVDPACLLAIGRALRAWEGALVMQVAPGSPEMLAAVLISDVAHYLDKGMPGKTDLSRLWRELAEVVDHAHSFGGYWDRRDGLIWKTAAALVNVLREHCDTGQDRDHEWATRVVDRFLRRRANESRDQAGADSTFRSASGDQPYERHPDDIGPILPYAVMYSNRATASDRALREALDGQAMLEDAIARAFGRRRHGPGAADSASPVLIRTLPADDELMEAMVAELARRGADPTGGRAHLVLIHEWDSFYARSLPDELWSRIGAGSERLVHQFSYQRGLDGAVPGARSEDAKEHGGRVSASASRIESISAFTRRAAEAARPPDGTHQFDYVRRIGDSIRRLDQDLRRGGERVAAIGVVGSDVYDKLVVLQALRPMLPDAVYFTTDLDAQLLHPSQSDWARNLVVVSGYGLTARPDVQGSLPPFRDGYQVSTFLACLAALGHEAIVGQCKECPRTGAVPDTERFRHPRLFEVGRSGAVDLTVSRRGMPLANFHPDRTERGPGGLQTAALVGAVLVVGVLAMPMSGRVRRFLSHVRSAGWGTDPGSGEETAGIRRLMWILLGCLAIPGLARLLILIDGSTEGFEPWGLLDGVSSWPTEVARMIIVAMGLFLITDLPRRLRTSAESIERRFLSGLTEDGTAPVPDGATDVTTAWHAYANDESWRCRAVRAAPWVVLLLVLPYLLAFGLGAPAVPVRGWFARSVDAVLAFLAYGVIVITAVMAVDVLRRCTHLINQMAASRTRWPAGVIQEVREQLGLDDAESSELLEVRLIRDRTTVVAPVVIYPFVLIFITVVARNSLLDNWTWAAWQIGLYVLIGAGPIWAALHLRTAAERARASTLGHLERAMIRAEHRHPQKLPGLRHAVKEVSEMREGAFARYLSSPIVTAIIIPFGGVGLVVLLEVLAAMGI